MRTQQFLFRNVVQHHLGTKQDRLRFFRKELAEARRNQDMDAVRFCQDAIREMTRPASNGLPDRPLFPLKRPKTRKSSKR